MPSGELLLDNYWISNEGGNGIEGLSATGNHVFVSTANGCIYAWDKNDISAGPEYTFSHEVEHEHLGRAILIQDDKLYWADWGAGFATIDMSTPSNMTTISIITHSSYYYTTRRCRRN
jgi:hypothetical protein